MKKPKGCIFCKLPQDNRDESNYILYRGTSNFIIMNNYPYNNGHLMVAPYRHAKDLSILDNTELHQHIETIRLAESLLRKAFNPEGFNIGMNIGKIAGAGVEGHVHTHIIPRWSGDTNFMPVLSNTKVIPEGLRESYRKLKRLLPQISKGQH
jgi:ATP adenylyltransferase